MSKSNSIYIPIHIIETPIWPGETCLLLLIHIPTKTLEIRFFIAFRCFFFPRRDSQKNSCFQALDDCIIFSKINIISSRFVSYFDLVTTSSGKERAITGRRRRQHTLYTPGIVTRAGQPFLAGPTHAKLHSENTSLYQIFTLAS